MSEIILSLHVVSGIVAVVSSFGGLFKSLFKLKIAFWPSITVVGLSGVSLMFTGASILRVCASGIILAVILVVIHKFSAKNLATQKIDR